MGSGNGSMPVAMAANCYNGEMAKAAARHGKRKHLAMAYGGAWRNNSVIISGRIAWHSHSHCLFSHSPHLSCLLLPLLSLSSWEMEGGEGGPRCCLLGPFLLSSLPHRPEVLPDGETSNLSTHTSSSLLSTPAPQALSPLSLSSITS